MATRTTVSEIPHMRDRWVDELNGGVDPSKTTIGSHSRAHWACDKGHTWTAPVCEVYRGRGCAVCRGLQVVPGVNDFASKYPERAAMWHPDKNKKTPEKYTPGSGARVWFICDNGHEFDTVLRRVSEGRWCRYCAGKDVWSGGNDLLTTDPDLALEWDYSRNGGLTPKDVSRGSNKKVWWVCAADTTHAWRAKPNDRTKSVNATGCPKCYARGSRGQTELFEYISELLPNTAVWENHIGAVPGRMELDIYLPDKNIAFEFHGLYFHSDGPRGSRTSTSDKVEHCEKAGIDLYIVWEDDWRDRNTIMKRWVSSVVGASEAKKINARDCSVANPEYREVREFLEENHVQGPATGRHYIGLQKDNALVAIAVFSAWGGGDTLKLERYATSANVRGGFSKIMSYLDKTVTYKTVETFADLAYSKGNLYESTGWTEDSRLGPDYKYLYGKKRVHKFNFRKEDFRDSMTATGGRKFLYEPGKTEKELADMNKIHRVYDAGKIKYTRDRPNV